ncbi:MAG: hypothetical protein ACO23B_12575, partial [Burkholderiaceae bacterium]
MRPDFPLLIDKPRAMVRASRISLAGLLVLTVAALLLLGGCRGVDVYHTYTLEGLPQIEKRFANLKDKKLKRTLLKLLMVQKIRVSVQNDATSKVSIYRSYDMSPDLLLDSREVQLELPAAVEKHSQCAIRDEQNWICDEFVATRLEMRNGQLYIAGIRLEKNTALGL